MNEREGERDGDRGRERDRERDRERGEEGERLAGDEMKGEVCALWLGCQDSNSL